MAGAAGRLEKLRITFALMKMEMAAMPQRKARNGNPTDERASLRLK